VAVFSGESGLALAPVAYPGLVDAVAVLAAYAGGAVPAAAHRHHDATLDSWKHSGRSTKSPRDNVEKNPGLNR
jgi:hypothetical protein